MSPRRMLDVVRANESDEFLRYFPELRPTYDAVNAKFERLCDETDAALACRWSSAPFARRSGKCASARAFAAACTQQAVERALGERLVDFVPDG